MSRLYYQVYLTIIGGLALVIVAAGAVWQMTGGRISPDQILERAGELASQGLLSADADPVIRRKFLDDIHVLQGVDVALFGPDHRLIDTAGRPLPKGQGDEDGGNPYGAGYPVLGIRLRDGGWIEVRDVFTGPTLLRKLSTLAALAIIIAIFCYPVVRYLTRRLERLQLSVESLGSGDLTARVKVEGRDEVARLAQTFNRAAAQIEQLVEAHKLLLANVSHELRTPLSRLRLTAELLKEVADPKRKADLEKDVTEIDALIEQILLSSRLDAVAELDVCEDVDLLALAAEEGARCAESDIMGEPVVVRGDPALLQRMIRNLIENAQQHGLPPIEARVHRQGQHAVLRVSDAGPGIAPSEREHVFRPFYRPPETRSPGSGLGLALVRQIACQHGGKAVWAGPSVIEVTIPADGGNEVRPYA